MVKQVIFKMEDVHDTTIEEILETAAKDVAAVILEGQNNAIFLRQSFLSKFRSSDRVVVSGESLHHSWGWRSCFWKQRTGALPYFYTEPLAAIPEGWRCNTNLGQATDLVLQIGKARLYCHTLTVTAYFV